MFDAHIQVHFRLDSAKVPVNPYPEWKGLNTHIDNIL